MAVEIGGAPSIQPVEISAEDGYLIIKAKFMDSPKPSNSGRSFLVATGTRVMAPFTVNGKPLNVSFNATISAK